jgi:hypothetical protein
MIASGGDDDEHRKQQERRRGKQANTILISGGECSDWRENGALPGQQDSSVSRQAIICTLRSLFQQSSIKQDSTGDERG